VRPDSLATFYRGKTVLVTGHTGFKGGWLSEWLKILGARVIGLALPPETQPNLFEAARIGEGMSTVLGDIRDLKTVRALFDEHAPEIVFHNAAQALVRRAYRDPPATYATNVMGTVHVLEAVRRARSVRVVVVISSDKCYENREWVWGYRETDPIGGRDPYSSSKACVELVTAAYRRSFFAQADASATIASARAGNVIGGGDWADDRLVPDIVRGIATGQAIALRNPGALRPWQHVLEPVRGYLTLAQRLWASDSAYAEPWNFGPAGDGAMSVSELARRVIATWGKGELVVKNDGEQPPESQDLRLDSSKARLRLGWQTILSADESVQLTVDWYRSYLDNPECAPQVTARQLRDYMRKADP